MSEPDPFAELAESFGEHYETVRGIVRLELVMRQLNAHLPPVPAKVIDIGGGGGQVALRLALAGYAVTIADPSAEMLGRAETLLSTAPQAVRGRVDLVAVSGQEAPHRFGDGTFDAVCCHGVLAYLDEPDAMIGAWSRWPSPMA